ncbi:hypothetical protein KIN20_020524 [Parelaphostrongylus tenuis]|uniref:Uncharacterized protein n=1 Tax=Parelaphostrongylus tenuis TaxID=148309 RepID=A0AAD5MMR8_PARTN|nr:hypothetical protein KIN20_020524 [Parelaphostrongylus tenuis]
MSLMNQPANTSNQPFPSGTSLRCQLIHGVHLADTAVLFCQATWDEETTFFGEPRLRRTFGN